MSANADLRHNWTLDEVRALFNQPFNDLPNGTSPTLQPE